MLRTVTSLLLGLIFFALVGTTTAGSVNEVERVEGAFTGFEVETENDEIVAVHFAVGDRRVVAGPDSQISDGNPGVPAVLLTLAEFVELADARELSGAVEGAPGDEVLFARNVFIDPFDEPGDPVVVRGALTDFAGVFEDNTVESLIAVQFNIAGEPAVAGEDTYIRLERGDRGPIVLRLGQFLELGLDNDLTGEVTGVVDEGVITVRRIHLDALDEPPGPVVLEGPFSDFEAVSNEVPNTPTPGRPDILTGVSFHVDGDPAQATADTQIVLVAPTLAVDQGTQLSLAEFLDLGLSAELAGRVEGQLREGVVLARHILIRRVDRPDDRVEIEGRLRACELGDLESLLSVQIRRSDRLVTLLITPNTLLFFGDDNEDPIGQEDLARICESRLVVEVFARGILTPNASNDAVQILATEAVFEYVDADIRGRFQGGEVGNEQIKIAIGDVGVVVDPQTEIEFEGNELSFAGFADLVNTNNIYFARAAGFLRKDGAILARRMTVERVDPPPVDVAGRLVSCEETSAEQVVQVVIQRGDTTTIAQVTPNTRLAEKRGDGLAELTLGEFVEKCNERRVYSLFGIGPDAEPLVLSKVIISLVRVSLRGKFQGGEVSDEEVVIDLSERTVRVNPETKIFGVNREPIAFDEFVELVEAGERHLARVRGFLLKDNSIEAIRLRLRARPNITVDTPVDGGMNIRGRGTPGIDVEVFDAQGTRLASGAVNIIGLLNLSTDRVLVLGETITPYALGLAEQAPSVKSEQVFRSGFE